MHVVAAVAVLVVCAFPPSGAWLFLWERRSGGVVYMRNRESEPVVEVTPRFFLWSRPPLILAPAPVGISLLLTLQWALWAVLVYTLSVVGTVALMVVNCRRERHNPRYRGRQAGVN